MRIFLLVCTGFIRSITRCIGVVSWVWGLLSHKKMNCSLTVAFRHSQLLAESACRKAMRICCGSNWQDACRCQGTLLLYGAEDIATAIASFVAQRPLVHFMDHERLHVVRSLPDSLCCRIYLRSLFGFQCVDCKLLLISCKSCLGTTKQTNPPLGVISCCFVQGGTLINYEGKLRLLEIAQVPKDHVRSGHEFEIYDYCTIKKVLRVENDVKVWVYQKWSPLYWGGFYAMLCIRRHDSFADHWQPMQAASHLSLLLGWGWSMSCLNLDLADILQQFFSRVIWLPFIMWAFWYNKCHVFFMGLISVFVSWKNLAWVQLCPKDCSLQGVSLFASLCTFLILQYWHSCVFTCSLLPSCRLMSSRLFPNLSKLMSPAWLCARCLSVP